MIDPELVNRKLSLIIDNIEKLSEWEEITKEDYLADLEYRLKTERLLERIINRLIDLNYHIVTEEISRQPKDYYESFILLIQTGFYDSEQAEHWAQLAGLRNRLAHEYNDLKDNHVYDAYQSLLSELPPLLEKLQTEFGELEQDKEAERKQL